MLLIPVVIAATLAVLAGMTLSFNERVGTLHDDRGLPEQILGVLASDSARVITLTGRPNASVRLVYDPVRRRGALIVVRLAAPRDDLMYRVLLIQRGVPRSVASFVPAEDRATFVPIQADFSNYDAVAIVVGSHRGPAITATPVMRATFAVSAQRLRPTRHTRPLRME
jgi:hypothetical protein